MKHLLILLALIPLAGFGQSSRLAERANEKFTFGNYEGALEDYLELLEYSPDDTRYIYRVAVCYLNTNLDKTKAIPHLEKLASANPVENVNTYYLLGRAYHFAHRFDEAIAMYNKYQNSDKGLNPIDDVEKQIEYSYNAKELVKFPLDVQFVNLGPEINTPYAEFFPFVPEDESFIIYNTRRDDGSLTGLDGQFASNVYLSRQKAGKFTPGKAVGAPVNTKEGDEEVVGLSADGHLVLFYYENTEGEGDLYMGGFDEKGNILKPEPLPKVINSKDIEIAASITGDGEAIYFASTRSGGYGGVDIYVSRKLPTGKWGPAQNLGPAINTSFDEDFPNISADGSTLYFSSKGHTSMGGYDIFKAEFDATERNWVKVRNVGYPINSTRDDMNLRMSETGRHGYISSLREGGVGDFDIYRVTFNQVDPKFLVVKGAIESADTTRSVTAPMISVISNETEEIYGDYQPNPNSGRYIVILPPGSFRLEVLADGFKPYVRNFSIEDISSIETEEENKIILLPLNSP